MSAAPLSIKYSILPRLKDKKRSDSPFLASLTTDRCISVYIWIRNEGSIRLPATLFLRLSSPRIGKRKTLERKSKDDERSTPGRCRNNNRKIRLVHHISRTQIILAVPWVMKRGITNVTRIRAHVDVNRRVSCRVGKYVRSRTLAARFQRNARYRLESSRTPRPNFIRYT